MALVQRRLVLLAGGAPWAERATSAALAAWPRRGRGPRLLRADLRDPPVKAWMGQELDLVVLTAHRRRFLDTFGAVAGALKGGGVLLFHTPPLETWRKERLGARWCKLLDSLCNDPRTAGLVTVYREEDGEPQGLMDAVTSFQADIDIDRNSMMPNQEQAALLQTILKIKASRPLLIFGRRGRGKSALLGMAAAVLLQKGCRIIVTSPSKDATSQVFWAAETYLGEKPRRMEFIEPNRLLTHGRHLLKESFLIIDEAAGFPVNFTSELLEAAGRVLLATTLDGYEGSGNGFLVRAVPRLRQARPALQMQQLSFAWRWTEGCPLEAGCFLRGFKVMPSRPFLLAACEALSRSALLLDAAPVTLEKGEKDHVAQHAQVEKVDRESFTDEELKELYGLLRIGHYKTKPSDLETFLDAKGIIWLSLKHENKHVGITISGIEEPVEDAEKAHGLWLGRCQVPQNLTAQTLSRDAGSLEASQLRYCRMMRWCLHPALRGYGLGERLLEQSLVQLKCQDVDAVAAHFGATSWLMKLWLRQGAQIVFVSHGCDPSSGQHSISVLIPRSEAARQLVKCLQKQLAMQIFELLAGPLADMEKLKDAVKELLKALPIPLTCSSDPWTFAFGARRLSHCRAALRHLAARALQCDRTRHLPAREEQLLLSLLQEKPLIENHLRKVVRKLLSTSLPGDDRTEKRNL